jgi:7-cyano-7-deazaguanine synthase in queuosine biosynthesis
MKYDDSNTLLMFSGGLDSTGALWNLLQDETNKLHLHHLHLINPTKRAKAEQIAIKNILSHIGKNYSSIRYSESYHEYNSYSYLTKIQGTNRAILNENLISDSDMYNFMAGAICSSLPYIKRVAIGRTKSDNNPAVIERAARGNKLLKLFAPNVEKIYPVEDLTKREIYSMLPEELRDMTWSCRTPINTGNDTFKECRKCKTCLEISKIKDIK